MGLWVLRGAELALFTLHQTSKRAPLEDKPCECGGGRGQLERKKLTKVSSEWESILGGNKGGEGPR